MPDRLRMSERRDALVAAALALAEREGLAAVTVREVAREADVSTGVVHYCFTDKDDLLAAMAARLVRELRAAATVSVGGGKLEDVLLSGIRSLWRTLERSGDRQLLTYEITLMALRQEPLRDAARRQYEESHAAVRDFLVAAEGSTGRRWRVPVDQVAAFVLAQLDGVVLRWLVDRDTRTARRGLETLARLVVGLAEPAP
ncbi:TetR/AcrR family transcriptional regulator [Jatrophihabitans sp. YIM 134969]